MRLAVKILSVTCAFLWPLGVIAQDNWNITVRSLPEDAAEVAKDVAAVQAAPKPSPNPDYAALRLQGAEAAKNPRNRQPPAGTRIEANMLGGVQGEWVVAPGASDVRTVLYFGPGAYVRNTLQQGRGVAAAFSEAFKARVFSVAFAQAPEHPYPAGIDDGVKAYKGLLSLGVDPSRTIFAGISAGGSVIASVMLKLRDEGLPLPRVAVSMSPWADLTLQGSSWEINRTNDTITYEYTKPLGDLYAGAKDRRDPIMSPVFASLKGLPPWLIVVGDREMLLSDSQTLAANAHRDGVKVRLETYTGMGHVFPNRALRTGDIAIRSAAEWVDRHLQN